MHDTPTLQRRIDISADGIPSFGTERNALRSAVCCPRRLQATLVRLARPHQRSRAHVPEIIPFIVAEKQKAEDAALERERKIQAATLAIKKKYGKNAILKAMNLEEGATAKDRNAQIGGHKA